MILIINDVYTDKRGYVENLIAKIYGLTPELVKSINTSGDSKSSVIEIEKEHNFPKLTEAENRLLTLKKSCAIDDLAKLGVLQEGEEVISDTFSFLTNSHNDIPKNTPVLIRKTNFSQYTIIYPTLTVSNNQVSDVKHFGKYNKLPTNLLKSIEAKIATIVLKKLFEILKNKAQEEGFMEEIFGKKEEDKFKTLFDNIKDYFEGEKLKNIEEKIFAYRAWLKDDYFIRKRNYNKPTLLGASNPDDLRKDLKVRQEQLKEYISYLKNNYSDVKNFDYRPRQALYLRVNLLIFRLIILKEEAYWENIINKKNNISSNNALDIAQRTLEDNSKDILQLLKEFIEKRISYIGEPYEHIFGQMGMYQPGRPGYKMDDNFNSNVDDDVFKFKSTYYSKEYTMTKGGNQKEEAKNQLYDKRNDLITNLKKEFNQHYTIPIETVLDGAKNSLQ